MEVPGLPIAGIVVDLVSGITETILLLTGLMAGIFRTAAILGRSSPERAETITAIGFLSGIVLAVLLLALDVAVS
jgi:hypothetical protein